MFIVEVKCKSVCNNGNRGLQEIKMDSVLMLQLCWWSALYHPEKAVQLAEPSKSFASASKQSNNRCDVTIGVHTCQTLPVQQFAGIMTARCIVCVLLLHIC